MQRLLFIMYALVLGVTSLSAQSPHISLILGASQDTVQVTASQLDSVLNQQLNHYYEQGYWDAQISLSKHDQDSLLLIAQVETGSVTSIENIYFSGNNLRDQWYLNQEYLLGAATINVLKLEQAEHRLLDLGYQLKGERQISKDGQGKYHLKYSIADSPELNIDALAAFNQNSGSDTLAWFGHINLHVPNLDGKGKSISLNWKRLKTNSELFMIAYEHPWLFNNPLKAVFNFGREVVDGNYQIVQGKVGLEWNIDWERSVIFQYEDHQSLITKAGSILNPEWRSTRKQMLGLGYRYSDFDNIAHQGYRFRTSLFQELNFEPSSVSRLDLRLEGELKLFQQLYLSQKTALVIQNQTDVETDPSILMPLGGVNSVRGYEEDFVRSPSVISLQQDLHLPIGNQSQIIALMDFGLYYEAGTLKHLTGYGLGVQLRSGNGPIRITLASHSGVDIRNSFLHIEYSGGNSWIDR